MNARGTRRPHAKRVRSKPRTRASGGGGGGNKSCPLSMIALPLGIARGLAAEWNLRMDGAR